MARIFISYRRKDNADFAGRVYDKFIDRFGKDYVFIDYENILPAAKWKDAIKREIGRCDALVVIIGPQWLTLLQEKGASFEDDYVLFEIEQAVRLKKIIAPVCIKGALPPPQDKLPARIRSMFHRQAAQLDSDYRFHDDCRRWMDSLEAEISQRTANTAIAPQPTPSPQIVAQRRRIKLTSRISPERLDLDKLVEKAAQLAQVGFDDIEIELLEVGSIVITFAMPQAGAERLARIVREQPEQLAEFEITEAVLQAPELQSQRGRMVGETDKALREQPARETVASLSDPTTDPLKDVALRAAFERMIQYDSAAKRGKTQAFNLRAVALTATLTTIFLAVFLEQYGPQLDEVMYRILQAALFILPLVGSRGAGVFPADAEYLLGQGTCSCGDDPA